LRLRRRLRWRRRESLREKSKNGNERRWLDYHIRTVKN
jgi:hypothetical protein